MFAKGGKSLTLGAGGALQSLPADAAERVSINHTGPSVLTGVWQTAAVLRWRCKLTVSPPEKKKLQKVLSQTHQCCRWTPPSLLGINTWRHHLHHSRFLRCCRSHRRTDSLLEARNGINEPNLTLMFTEKSNVCKPRSNTMTFCLRRKWEKWR